MGLVRETIPNLVNGVSQQSMALRLVTQAEEQENAYSTLVEGLSKRPPTDHAAKLFNAAQIPADSYTHVIDRDDTERYVVNISNGSIKVTDMAGNPKTVNAPNGYGYLPTSGFNSKIKVFTNTDYTFIVNTDKVVAKKVADVSPTAKNEALVHVISGNYGKRFTISIDSANAEHGAYETPPGDNAKQSPAVGTEFIARRLRGGCDAAGTGLGASVYWGQDIGSTGGFSSTGAPGFTWSTRDHDLYTHLGLTITPGWRADLYGSVLHIYNTANVAFSINVSDGFAGRAMKAIKGSVKLFSDLPNRAPVGFLCEVSGTDETNSDNYFVKYTNNGAVNSTGYWQECLGPGLVQSIDEMTMPFVLVRESNGTFTFKPFDWDKREAGDDLSNPFPSFVGRRIRDIFLWRARLGLLADEYCCLSATSDFGRFFRTTATALLDDDPVDVPMPVEGAVTLDYGVNLQGKLMLWSSSQQFLLKADQIASPKTISAMSLTSFEAASAVRPIVAGRYAYFPLDRGNFSAVREYFVDEQTESGDANDITSHVPTYIPSGIRKLIASTHEDLLLAYRDTSNEVYAYKYYWNGDQKLQGSWSRWTLPGVSNILNALFVRSTLYLVVRRTNGDVFLETLPCNPGRVDPNVSHTVHLDRRVSTHQVGPSFPVTAQSYNSVTDRTTYTLAYVLDTTLPYRAVENGYIGPSPEITAGNVYPVLSVTSNTIVVQGDTTAKSLWLGINYDMSYTFSRFYVREASKTGSGGSVVVIDGRLQILRLALTFTQTVFFKMIVSALGKPDRVLTYTGTPRVTSEAYKHIYPTDGQKDFPILSRNDRVVIKIVNDSPFQSALLSAEWTGQYNPKAQGL